MVESNSSKNVTIVKNSIFLFIRTFVSVVVTLFTSRILLNQLGVEDFGIYNLVGGVVVIFYVLTSFMMGASQRFLSIEIGKGDIKELDKLLNICITIHLVYCVVFIVIGEIVGLILLYNCLKVPAGKESIAQIVFHFSLISSVFSIISIPYNALIVAREKMSFFAKITIFDVLLKLVITLSLILVSQKLIIYSILIFLANVAITYAYYYYCKVKLSLPKFHYYPYKTNDEYREMLGYSVWSAVGYFASALREQGTSVVLNMFFGVVVNAAMGIVTQVTGVFSRLFLNLQAAFRPQIMQNAYNNRDRYDYLMNICTFYTILLMGLICPPMIIGCNTILTLWLGTVPKYTVLFVQLMMVKVFLSALTQCFGITIEAFSNLKKPMVYSASVSVIIIAIAYLTLRMGFPAYWAIILLIASELAYLLYRIVYAYRQGLVNLKTLFQYNWSVILMCTCFICAAFFLASFMENHIVSIILMTVQVVLYCSVSLVVIKPNQRKLVLSKIKSIFHI